MSQRKTVPLSVLELVTVQEGSGAQAAFAAVTALARRADELGLTRFWLAEHHGCRSVGSIAPAVLAAHLAAGTARIRLGSGGVLLPHHAPVVVAEQFATLSALYPGRIDLGVGRGPGTTDPRVLGALRSDPDAPSYRADLAELLRYLSGDASVRVLSGTSAPAQPWLLSSSVSGAELAAEFGLPLAFGHHIRPGNTVEALARYRERFRPSRWRDRPYAMVSVETVCAPTDEEAEQLAKPAAVTMAAAFQGNGPDAAFLSPEEAARQHIPAPVAERLAALRATQAHGGPDTVAGRLAHLVASTDADELILHTPVYDSAARVRSLELTVAAQASRNIRNSAIYGA